MSALRFGITPTPSLQLVPVCELAIEQGELRILSADWGRIKEQFTIEERAQLREKVLIEIEAPVRGWYLSLKGLPRELVLKLVYALYSVGGLRELGE